MASHSIAYASSLLSDAWRPPSTQYTHSAPFNPVPVRLESVLELATKAQKHAEIRL